MDIPAMLNGQKRNMTAREHEALSCSGLFAEGSGQEGRLGLAVAHALMNLAGNAESDIKPSCGYPEDPLHVEANSFRDELLRDSVAAPEHWALRSRSVLSPWLDAINAGNPPYQIVLRFQPVHVERRTQKTLTNKAIAVKLNEARLLLNDRGVGLLCYDSATPEDGPAVWTIAYHLLDAPPTYELPESQLVSRVHSTLQGKISASTLADTCHHGMFRVREQFGSSLVSIDTSGLGSATCAASNKNIANTAGMLRIADAWFYECSTEKIEGDVATYDIPLSLAVHLAVLANLRSRPSEGDLIAQDAVVIVGERKGWLLLRASDIPGNATRPVFVKITDEGVIDVVEGSDLDALGVKLPELPGNLLEGCQALADIYGLQLSELTWPTPSQIMQRLTTRGKHSGRVSEQLGEYLLTLIDASQR